MRRRNERPYGEKQRPQHVGVPTAFCRIGHQNNKSSKKRHSRSQFQYSTLGRSESGSKLTSGTLTGTDFGRNLGPISWVDS